MSLLHKKQFIAGVAILALATGHVYAATPPNSGTLENIKPPTPQQIAPHAPDILVEGQGPAASGGEQKLTVKGFRLTGQLPMSQKELLQLINDKAGKEFSLTDLNTLSSTITQYLRSQGYLVANAYIPAQTIQDGIVQIEVVIGKYGKIDIRNHSTLKMGMADAFFGSLKPGDYIRQDKLDRTLLLVNDIVGITAKATLVPGAQPGTSDLIVDITDGVKTRGEIYADNHGNRYTGANELGFIMNRSNISGAGDMISLGGSYTGSGMNTYNLGYLLPTGGQGARLGVSYSRMHYLLGKEFASLNATGIAKTSSIFETFSLVRSRSFNLNGRIGYDSKILNDRTDSNDSQKHADIWNIGISGDSQDGVGGGGINSFGLTYASGRLNLNSADAITNDAQAQTAGGYQKTNLTFSRLQYLNPRLNLSLAFTGQLANKNLDSSEKLQIGGPAGVRAYPVGEAPADQGYIFTSELRWNLPTPNFQMALYYDNGKAILNKNPWPGTGINERILAGAGLSFIWNRPGNYTVRLDYAWEITTNDPATSDTNKNGRLWLQAVKYF